MGINWENGMHICPVCRGEFEEHELVLADALEASDDGETLYRVQQSVCEDCAGHSKEKQVESKGQPEAILWHTEREQGRNLYHITIADGSEKIDLIVKYRTSDKYLESEPYVVHEMDYTVHDSCNHEDDYCVLEDPHSDEYLEIEIETRRNIAHSELDKKGEGE